MNMLKVAMTPHAFQTSEVKAYGITLQSLAVWGWEGAKCLIKSPLQV